MRKYQVAVSGEAQRMLKDHVFFPATINPDAAERLRQTIVERIRSLARMPERHPYLDPDDRRNPCRKDECPSGCVCKYTQLGKKNV
jgi:plasmid stabilization system protein ParE